MISVSKIIYRGKHHTSSPDIGVAEVAEIYFSGALTVGVAVESLLAAIIHIAFHSTR
jgi:hypothetical protein